MYVFMLRSSEKNATVSHSFNKIMEISNITLFRKIINPKETNYIRSVLYWNNSTEVATPIQMQFINFKKIKL